MKLQKKSRSRPDVSIFLLSRSAHWKSKKLKKTETKKSRWRQRRGMAMFSSTSVTRESTPCVHITPILTPLQRHPSTDIQTETTHIRLNTWRICTLKTDKNWRKNLSGNTDAGIPHLTSETPPEVVRTRGPCISATRTWKTRTRHAAPRTPGSSRR